MVRITAWLFKSDEVVFDGLLASVPCTIVKPLIWSSHADTPVPVVVTPKSALHQYCTLVKSEGAQGGVGSMSGFFIYPKGANIGISYFKLLTATKLVLVPSNDVNVRISTSFIPTEAVYSFPTGCNTLDENVATANA